jgi:hypothetical protein
MLLASGSGVASSGVSKRLDELATESMDETRSLRRGRELVTTGRKSLAWPLSRRSLRAAGVTDAVT